MSEPTPTPWVAGDSEHGIYPIWAKCGPLDVQPATAHGSDDAAFIVKAVNSYDALVKVLELIDKQPLWVGDPETYAAGFQQRYNAIVESATGVIASIKERA